MSRKVALITGVTGQDGAFAATLAPLIDDFALRAWIDLLERQLAELAA